METKDNCPICGCNESEKTGAVDIRDIWRCANCGRFALTREARINFQRADARERAILSHGIWQKQADEGLFTVTAAIVDAAIKNPLPTPAEQLDNLVLFIGDQTKETPSESINEARAHMRAKMGAILETDVGYVEKMGTDMGWVNQRSSGGCMDRLTYNGWQRYEELKKGKAAGRTAFMAMPFGNAEVDAIFENVFRPAVKETGFNLKRVDDEPEAGIIDNKIRVDIRMCRFLIADLTCCNRGAYWEAGYAEGLGKPVIYTCNTYYFKQEGTHFDTNHCTTVVWDPAAPEAAAKNLKATIRNSLPFEAKMEDEE